MKSVLMFLFMACALLPGLLLRAQVAQDTGQGGWLVPPMSAEELEALGIEVVEEKSFVFYPGPKIMLKIRDKGKHPIDSVTLRVFDAGHRLLGEYCSSDYMDALFSAVMLCDSIAINYYGTYYVEASKPGYRTVEFPYEAREKGTRENPAVIFNFTMKREGGGAWPAVAVVVVVAGGAWWLARRRR